MRVLIEDFGRDFRQRPGKNKSNNFYSYTWNVKSLSRPGTLRMVMVMDTGQGEKLEEKERSKEADLIKQIFNQKPVRSRPRRKP